MLFRSIVTHPAVLRVVVKQVEGMGEAVSVSTAVLDADVVISFLDKARVDGLGDFDLDTIEIIGELTPIADFKVPPLGGEAILGNETIQELIRSRAGLRPRVDPDRCTACETCVDQCPVGALTMVDDIPVADVDTCITCFCCQEICPEQAIVLE